MSTLAEDPVFKEILDKLTGIEKSVGRIDSRLDNLDSLVKEHNVKLTSFETSLQFQSDKMDEHQKEIDSLKTSLKTQQQSIDLLKKKLDETNNALSQEKSGRSEQDQYFRSSFFVKVAGIALQEGEELQSDDASNSKSLEVIQKIVDHCGIQGFDASQIDVCHRVGKEVFSPIIVKFKGKNDRARFFKQRGKMRDMKTDIVGFPLSQDQTAAILNDPADDILHRLGGPSIRGRVSNRGRGSGRGRGGGSTGGPRYQDSDGNVRLPFIKFYESLSKLNTDLLNKARDAAKDLGYVYPGYTVNGQVRVKRAAGERFIAIKCHGDLSQIK